MDKELRVANAFISDEKLKNFINGMTDFSRRIDGDYYYYYSGETPKMRAVFTPLFEIDDGVFTPFLDIPVPDGEDELRAIFTTLYTRFYFIDFIEKNNRQIYVGLNGVEFL